MSIFKGITGLLNNASKVVPSFMKDHDKKLSSKRIFKLGGGGALIFTGIDFLNKAVETDNQTALIAGAVCIGIGSLLAIGLSEKIKALTTQDPQK